MTSKLPLSTDYPFPRSVAMGHFDFILQVIADCFIVLCDNKENNFILNNIIKQCQNNRIILFCIPPRKADSCHIIK